jgi:hypothetical protein
MLKQIFKNYEQRKALKNKKISVKGDILFLTKRLCHLCELDNIDKLYLLDDICGRVLMGTEMFTNRLNLMFLNSYKAIKILELYNIDFEDIKSQFFTLSESFLFKCIKHYDEEKHNDEDMRDWSYDQCLSLNKERLHIERVTLYRIIELLENYQKTLKIN